MPDNDEQNNPGDKSSGRSYDAFDFTDEKINAGPGDVEPKFGLSRAYKLKLFDQSEYNARMRGRIATLLMLLIFFAMLGPYGLIFYAVHIDPHFEISPFIQALKILVEPLFAGLIGITGTAMGFYFGSKNS